MLTLPFTNSLPKPKSHYLVSLSTPFGIMQHTSFDLADPHFGYSTDDNARALIAVNFWRHQETSSLPNSQPSLFAEIEERYLRFLKFMQTKDGRFYCFLTYDLKRKQLGVGDWFGRSLFALSFIVNRSERFDKPALSIIWRSLPVILSQRAYSTPRFAGPTAYSSQPSAVSRQPSANNFSLRTRAYLLLAFSYLLSGGKEHRYDLRKEEKILKKKEVKQLYRLAKSWGKDFSERLKTYEDRRWLWPEEKITYDNGKVIQAYFLLGSLLEKNEYIKQGEQILNFYLGKTMKNGYFRAPGNAHGNFWQKGQSMPYHDEQPLEAYSLITTLVSASLITNKKEYRKIAEKVYGWFFGKNRLRISLVEEKSGAVHDGLRKKDLNVNKGAESYLSLALSYFCLKHSLHL